MSTSPVLDVSGLSISLDGAAGVTLVDRVSFTVAEGRTLCIVGESGCGKSLLSLAIMGLLPRPAVKVSAGSVRLEDAEITALSNEGVAALRGRKMAMIFQEPMTSLNPAFTIGDQIGEALSVHQGLGAAEERAAVIALLRRVRIPSAEQRIDAYPHQMSGGMRQRVMIAMALANRPRLLIADEPTTALDVTIQAQILSLIREMQREEGTAVVLVTHDLGVVAEIADEVAVMYAGRIVERGPVGAIFEDPQHPYTIGLMGALPQLGGRQGRLLSIAGAVPPPASWPASCRFAPRCPFAVARCRAEAPPLVELGENHHAACFRAPLERHVGLSA